MENTTDAKNHENSAQEEALKEANSVEKEANSESREAAGEDSTQDLADASAEENAEDNAENNKNESQQNEGNEFKEKYYYLAAEMQNMQRRFEREKEDLLKYGNEKIMRDLVAIVDNFERSLGFIQNEEDEKVKTIAEGISMVNKLFIETLEKHGLKKIEALGKEFDPNFHEALAQQPAEGKNDMEVIQVFENGYTLNDRVVRAAKVIVAKN